LSLLWFRSCWNNLAAYSYYIRRFSLIMSGVKKRQYWLLGAGITIFLIGSYMYVNWILGLCIISCTQDFFKPGDFTFEKFASGTYRFFICTPPKTMFDPPPCFSDLANIGEYRSLYLWLPLLVWLAGLCLVVFSVASSASDTHFRRVVR